MDRVVNSENIKCKNSISDVELVAQCKCDDDAAFDELVLRHQQRAVNVAYQVLRDYEDATEVAQDAFVKIYRSMKEFRGECEFTTWLHQIVVNLARNKHRWWKRRGKQKTHSLDCPSGNLDDSSPRQFASSIKDPSNELIDVEYVSKLNDKIYALPYAYRQVLILRNMEDLSYEEIATVLRCSVGTVKSRIARAREALRQSMETDG